jgi:hypothetical protein
MERFVDSLDSVKHGVSEGSFEKGLVAMSEATSIIRWAPWPPGSSALYNDLKDCGVCIERVLQQHRHETVAYAGSREQESGFAVRIQSEVRLQPGELVAYRGGNEHLSIGRVLERHASEFLIEPASLEALIPSPGHRLTLYLRALKPEAASGGY